MALQDCVVNTDSSNRELKPHGTQGFPCAGYEMTFKNFNDDIVPWHWHREFEAVYVNEGELNLRVLSNNFTIKKGEGALINSNALHYASSSSSCLLQSLVFSPLLAAGSESSDFYTKYIAPLASCQSFSCIVFGFLDENVKRVVKAFNAIKYETFAFEFTVRENLCQLLVSAYTIFRPQLENPVRAQSVDALRLSKMLDYIQRNFSKNITLNDICGAANVGSREALRCFKRTIKEPPVQYLLKYRLMKSAEMLLSFPMESVLDIAFKCGFDSPSYYAKKFRELYSCAPHEYRKKTESK